MNQNSETGGPFERLVVLGESTVEGGGWIQWPGERFSDILWKQLETAQEKPIAYHNAGVGASVISPASPGYEASTKPSAAERLDDEVIAKKPDLLVIAYGLNDMRAGMPHADFRVELEKIIGRIKERINPLIVIVNVYHMSAYHYYPPFDKGSVQKTQEYNTMLLYLASENKCVYADVWDSEKQKDFLIHPDTVHANKVGNMIIANKVFEAVIQESPGILKNVNKRDAGTDWTKGCLKIQKQSVEKSHKSY